MATARCKPNSPTNRAPVTVSRRLELVKLKLASAKLKKRCQQLLTQQKVAPLASELEERVIALAAQFGLNRISPREILADPIRAEALLKTLAAYARELETYAQELERKNRKLSEEVADYKAPELIRELREALSKDPGILRRYRQPKQPRAKRGEARNELSKWICDSKRSSRFTGEFKSRPGLIEEQFGWVNAHQTADCLDVLLTGGQVKMSGRNNSLETLFKVNRKRLYKLLRRHDLPPIKRKKRLRLPALD